MIRAAVVVRGGTRNSATASRRVAGVTHHVNETCRTYIHTYIRTARIMRVVRLDANRMAREHSLQRAIDSSFPENKAAVTQP